MRLVIKLVKITTAYLKNIYYKLLQCRLFKKTELVNVQKILFVQENLFCASYRTSRKTTLFSICRTRKEIPIYLIFPTGNNISIYGTLKCS